MTKTRINTIHFGAEKYPDYTAAPNVKEGRKRYIEPHKTNQDWTDGLTAGALSRYILWEYSVVNTASSRYFKRFKLPKYDCLVLSESDLLVSDYG